MATSRTVSVRLDAGTLDQLRAMATATARPRAWLMAQAIKQYVAQEEWHIGAIEEGRSDVAAGHTVDHANVKDWVVSWDRKGEKRRPSR